MAKAVRRRGSILGGLLLIVLGSLFLYSNFDPSFSPWPLLARFWPLLLVFWGLAKLLDYVRAGPGREGTRPRGITAGDIFLIVFIILAGLVISAAVRHEEDIFSLGGPLRTETRSVGLKGADSVRVDLLMRAGSLTVVGGADQLLQGEFRYNNSDWKPSIDYEVAGGQGRLHVRQPGGNLHIGHERNEWDLRLNNNVPMELNLEMGAGRADLTLGGLSLSRVTVEGGAGELSLDLTGDWERDLAVQIQGGVGRVAVRLPRHVGVEVSARGGLGAVHAGGLHRRGRTYVNDALGESDVTLRVDIKGGIGEIDLEVD